MRILSITELIVDLNLYPRSQIDDNHVSYMLSAYKAKSKFPPIVIDQKSKRIVDGVHRYNMYKRIDKGMSVEVIEKQYKDDAEMFWHAMRLNSNHGKGLTPFDRAKCISKAHEIGLTYAQIANALLMPLDSVDKMRVERMGKLNISGKMKDAPLKRTIRHMAGKTMTENQWQANDKLGGMNQQFYVEQLVTIIESNLLDAEDENLMQRLKHLKKLLNESLK